MPFSCSFNSPKLKPSLKKHNTSILLISSLITKPSSTISCNSLSSSILFNSFSIFSFASRYFPSSFNFNAASKGNIKPMSQEFLILLTSSICLSIGHVKGVDSISDIASLTTSLTLSGLTLSLISSTFSFIPLTTPKISALASSTDFCISSTSFPFAFLISSFHRALNSSKVIPISLNSPSKALVSSGNWFTLILRPNLTSNIFKSVMDGKSVIFDIISLILSNFP